MLCASISDVRSNRICALLVASVVITCSVAPALAQSFSSGSNGSDGPLNITLATHGPNFEFDPASFKPPLDSDGDGVYHFTTINVEAGVTVRITERRLDGPVFWLATGDVTIGGVLDLAGENGVATTPGANGSSRTPAIPGGGGFSGGIGGTPMNAAGYAGHGPGGAAPSSVGSGGGGAGHATAGQYGGCQNNAGGAMYGNSFSVPLTGGSGGSGGRGSASHSGPGGGAGGGAILIASSTSIAVSGAIRANGGQGGAVSSGSGTDGAGGGSGGSIHFLASTISGAGALSAVGGLGSPGIGGCGAGGAGSVGRIRLESVQRPWTFSISPPPTVTTPIQVHLPFTPAATVQVLSVTDGSGTHPVPANPSGSFTMPDVTINDSDAVTFNIEARYVPPGTIVKLHLISEDGPDQLVDSTPLAGPTELSIATATVTLPSGFSRGYLSTSWTP